MHLSKRVVQRGKKTSPLLRVCVSLGFALFWICPGLLYLSWIYSILWTFQKKLPEERAYKYPDIELSYYDFTTHFFPQIFMLLYQLLKKKCVRSSGNFLQKYYLALSSFIQINGILLPEALAQSLSHVQLFETLQTIAC